MAEKHEKLSEEQAAEMADIERRIERLEPEKDAAQAGADVQVQEVPAMSDAQVVAEFLGLVPMSAELAGLKKTAGIWGAATRDAVAEKAVAVMLKYEPGRRMLAWMRSGAYVDEVALVLTVWPIIKATNDTAKNEIREMRYHAKGQETDEQGVATGDE